MPTFRSTQSGDWTTVSYKGVPLASGKPQQWVNLYRTASYLRDPMAYFRYGSKFKRRKMSHRRGKSVGRSIGFRRRKKPLTSGRGVTFEHDRQHIYKKKRMPRRMKRRWRKFRGRVHAVAEKELGSRTVIFNRSYQQTAGATNQGRIGVSLYGWDTNDTNKTWYGDLTYMARLENIDGNEVEATNGDLVSQDSNIMFQSGVLDLTMRNTSYLAGTTSDLSSEATQEVDVYEISVRKEAELKGSNLVTLESIFVDAASTGSGIFDANTPNAVGTPVNLNLRGTTPFDVTPGLSQFGVKIWKKTKFFIRNGQTATYQIRDPRRHVFNRRKIMGPVGTGPNGINGFNMPGISKFLLVVFKLIPGVVEGTGANQTTSALTVGVTRKYMYKIEGIKDNRSIHVSR